MPTYRIAGRKCIGSERADWLWESFIQRIFTETLGDVRLGIWCVKWYLQQKKTGLFSPSKRADSLYVKRGWCQRTELLAGNASDRKWAYWLWESFIQRIFTETLGDVRRGSRYVTRYLSQKNKNNYPPKKKVIVAPVAGKKVKRKNTSF